MKKREQGVIAVIGMDGCVPQADNLIDLWKLLSEGREAITRWSADALRSAGVSEELLKQPNYVRSQGVLEDVDLFDALYFQELPRDAQLLDPQQRLLLEKVSTALQHAGYDSADYRPTTGLYVGVDQPHYQQKYKDQLGNLIDETAIAFANDRDFVASRIAYKLGLQGPALTVQTACSTSLVAVHLACQALLSGECDLAVAGGATVRLPQLRGYLYKKGQMLAADGHCRPFSEEATGTVLSSGVGVVILKRLSDAMADGDTIWAVIKGSAVNQDGAEKRHYFAPSIVGQTAVIKNALDVANVSPETISYVEGHGLGTVQSDTAELTSLIQAFRSKTEKTNFCGLGSIKANVGHLGAAAGVISLIKTILALQAEQLPPQIHAGKLNEQIASGDSPFFINQEGRPWQRTNQPRRAGVSAFGIGGTNVHLIVEEAPLVVKSSEDRNPWQLLLLSAKSETALAQMRANLATFLEVENSPDLADVAYTLQVGRAAHAYRCAVMAKDKIDAVKQLRAESSLQVRTGKAGKLCPKITFIFPGGGVQAINMGRDLYENEPVYRRAIDECAELLRPYLNLDIREIIYNPQDEPAATAQLTQISIRLPVLISTQYALAQQWIAWGIKPEAVMGYSLGEYTAGCVAGINSLAETLSIVAQGSALLQTLPKGAMLWVLLSKTEVERYLIAETFVAGINAVDLSVVSGSEAQIEQLFRQLTESKIVCGRVPMDVAMHSPIVEPILGAFHEVIKKQKQVAPQIKTMSAMLGEWLTAEKAMETSYWVALLRNPIQFATGMEKLLQEKNQLLIEVGVGNSLATLVRRQVKNEEQQVICSLHQTGAYQSARASLFAALGGVWIAGNEVRWEQWRAERKCRRVPLPSYPFERKSYWLGSAEELPLQTTKKLKREMVAQPSHRAEGNRPDNLSTDYVAPRTEIEKEVIQLSELLLKIKPMGVYDNFFELGGNSLLATQLLARIDDKYGVRLAIEKLFKEANVAAVAQQIHDIKLATKLLSVATADETNSERELEEELL